MKTFILTIMVLAITTVIALSAGHIAKRGLDNYLSRIPVVVSE